MVKRLKTGPKGLSPAQRYQERERERLRWIRNEVRLASLIKRFWGGS